MKVKALLIIMSVSVVAAGCSPMLEVKSDFNREANFENYKTYDLMPNEEVDLSEDVQQKFGERRQLIEDEMRKAVEDNMSAKGLVRDTSNPDILVAYYLGVRREIFMANYGMHYWQKTGNVDLESIRDGSMRIDFVDRKTEKVVWTGFGYGAVNRDPTEEMIKQNINRAVKKIIAQYPPNKKSAF